MSHSHLSFAGDRLPYSLNASHLTSAFPSTYPFNVFAAGLTELLQETDDVDVFRSVITTLEDSSFRFLAVCKVAYGFEEVEALEREVGFYQRELRHLQGKYIPRLFGYFVGTTVRGTTAALVTSDEGRPLLKPFACLSLQFRKRVYRGLRRIHQAGVHHGDVLEANLVVRRRKDGSYWPMIVDFDRARKHECEVKGKKTQIYGPCPEPGEDVCFELYAIGGEEGLDIWRPKTAGFEGSWIPAEAVTDVNSALESAAARGIISAKNLSPERSRMIAQRAVNYVHGWYDQRMKWDRSPESPLDDI